LLKVGVTVILLNTEDLEVRGPLYGRGSQLDPFKHCIGIAPCFIILLASNNLFRMARVALIIDMATNIMMIVEMLS